MRSLTIPLFHNSKSFPSFLLLRWSKDDLPSCFCADCPGGPTSGAASTCSCSSGPQQGANSLQRAAHTANVTGTTLLRYETHNNALHAKVPYVPWTPHYCADMLEPQKKTTISNISKIQGWNTSKANSVPLFTFLADSGFVTSVSSVPTLDSSMGVTSISPKHSGKKLTCQVVHQAWRECYLNQPQHM